MGGEEKAAENGATRLGAEPPKMQAMLGQTRLPIPLAALPYPMDTASRSALNQHFTLMNDDQCPGAADVLLLLPLLLPLLLLVSCVLCTAQRSMQQQQGQRNQNKARVPAGGKERKKGEQCKTETRGAALKCTKGACPKRE